MRGLSAVAVIAASASVLAVSACGSSAKSNGEAKKTGSEVAADAFAALKASGSVHIAGDTTDSAGKKSTIDLTLLPDAATGSLTTDGNKITLINAGGASYGKAPAEFYTAEGVSEANAAKVADKWAKFPAASGFDSFTLTKFAESFQKDKSKIEDKVVEDKVDGKKVVVVSQTDGSKLYVAAEGDPTPVKISGPPKEPGDLTFTDYGKKVDVKAPADAVDLSS